MTTPSPRDAATLRCPSCGAPADAGSPRCGYCSTRLATVACPKCLALVFDGTSHCHACGTAVARAEREGPALDCPHCRSPMAAARVGTLELTECAHCEGLWLDAASFERLCGDQEAQAAVLHGRPERPDATRGAGSVGAAVRYRPCPRCARIMNRVNFARISGVVLDVCKADGVFFDRDELHGIVRFIREGGLERSRAREKEGLAEERRRLEQSQSMTTMTHHSATVREHSVLFERGGGVGADDVARAAAHVLRAVRSLFA